MPFIHPLVFWTGLGAVSVPILIHLLNRRRFRVKDWAAMKFLLESIRKNRRRLRIEELILLALRCLAVLLLALAVSRFTGCSSARGAASEEGQGTSVFLLDDSLSMGQKVGVGSLFTAACGDLAGELERTAATNQVAIVPGCLAKTRGAIFSRHFLTDAKGLAARVRATDLSDWRMNLAEALSAANEQFRGVTGPKRLFVLSDFRRADLVGDEQISALRQEFSELRKQGVELVAMDYGRPAAHNLTVQEIRMLDKFAVAKAPLRFGVTVRNNGPAGASEVEVRPSARMTSAEGVRAVTLPIQMIHDLPAGQQATVEFPVVCQEPGPAVLTASLPADELMEDNTASLALEVRKYIRVLVVDGQPDLSDLTESESFYFCRAVDPRQDGSYGIRPEAVSEDGFSGASVEDYDAVVMMNVSRLPEDFVGGPARGPLPSSGPAPTTARRPVSAALEALEKYAREGGGLLVFAGNRVDVNYYNEALWAQGAGLLPFRVGATMGPPEPDFVRLDPKSIASDRCLQTFGGEGARFIDLVRFFRYLGAQEASGVAVGEAGAPRVLARFTDGQNSPAAAVRSFGKGTVLMFYSAGSARWNDWPTDVVGTFATVMYDTISYLARPQRPQTAEAGQPIVLELPSGWTDATAVLRTPKYPKEEEVVLSRPPDDKGRLLRYEVPTSAGVYGVRLKRPGAEERQVFHARNPDPAEGDLAPAGQGALTTALGSDDFLYRQARGGDAFGQVEAKAQKEYWKYALAALLAVLAAEVFLGQRFGHYSAGSQRQDR